jgi:hypothetical protein
MEREIEARERKTPRDSRVECDVVSRVPYEIDM